VHWEIFSKNQFLVGGLTFVRTYESQWSKHPHYLVRVGLFFYATNKSSTPVNLADLDVKILGFRYFFFFIPTLNHGIYLLDSD